MIEVTNGEIGDLLKKIDRSVSIEGNLYFPKNSHRRDLAVAKLIFGDRDVSAIYLFWKSADGMVHYRKMATTPIAHYNLKIEKVVALGVRDDRLDGDVRITFFAAGSNGPLFTKELRGKLPVGAARWKAGYPKKSLRLLRQ